jgi:hypothetical protein
MVLCFPKNLRPIAVGEALRRLAAKCSKASESLILVDFANAFISIDRQKMLEDISEEAPSKFLVVEENFLSIQRRAPQFDIPPNVLKCKQWSPVSSLPSAVAPVVAGVKVRGIQIGTRAFVSDETFTTLANKRLDRPNLPVHLLRSCLSAGKVTQIL